jgi:hypothetical protein
MNCLILAIHALYGSSNLYVCLFQSQEILYLLLPEIFILKTGIIHFVSNLSQISLLLFYRNLVTTHTL